MPETILIVDDEISQLRMAEFVVRDKLHYRVRTASGGQEAIDIVLSGKTPQLDLILLDLVMPGVNGLDVIRAVKAFRPNLPIIVFTQYGDGDNAVRAVQAGANDFLNKPVVLERLRLSIQNLLAMQKMASYIEKSEKLVVGAATVAQAESAGFLDAQGRMKKLETIEEEAIRFALEHADGCMTRAARSLGIGRSTLYRKLDSFNSRSQISRANHITRPMIVASSNKRS
ncbi:MAG: response regulator [Alphaproteobacteria bacterium]|nr:response regulator [Alphaproteobacteria bacterium]